MATRSSTLAWKIHGRSLVGYSPWGPKESDTTEQLYFTLLSLILHHFCRLGRYCFGKTPNGFPCLLQVRTNPSFSCCLA